MAYCVDWAASAPIFLQPVASSCELRGDNTTIQQLRLVCKAWSSATSQAVKKWHTHYSCSNAKLDAVARSFPSLSSVSLELCTCFYKVCLGPILGLTGLQELHLGKHGIEVPSFPSQALEGLTNLRSLDFCPIGDVAALRLTSLQKLSRLCVRGPQRRTVPGGHIDCFTNKIAAQALLEQGSVLTCLQDVMFSQMAFTSGAFNAIAALTQVRRLSLIEVMFCGGASKCMPDKQPAAFQSICQLTDLTELTIRQPLVCLRTITCISNLHHLTKLDLQRVGLLESLDGLQDVTALQCLNVSDLSSISTLEPIRGLTGLQELRFARCQMVQSFGVDVLSSLTRLQVLDMQCCAFTSRWIQLLTGLTDLTFLDMSVGNWRDQDIAQLTACTSLQVLGLRECPSTTPSMHQILQERLPSLASIDVVCSTSGDQYAGFLGWPY